MLQLPILLLLPPTPPLLSVLLLHQRKPVTSGTVEDAAVHCCSHDGGFPPGAVPLQYKAKDLGSLCDPECYPRVSVRKHTVHAHAHIILSPSTVWME
jgi:hypothetical protein